MKNHRKRWTSKEDVHLIRLINRNCSIDVAVSQLERTKASIFTRANYLGFGYKANKDDGKIYFLEDINHKNRRTKEEILADREKVPIKPAISVEDCDEKSTVIIAEKNIPDDELNVQQVLKELKELSAKSIQLIRVIEDAIWMHSN